MIWAGALLIAYAVALGTGGAIVLRHASWTTSTPRLGVVAWQTLSLSALAAIALAGLLMLSPGLEAHADLHGLFWSAQMLLQGQFADAFPALWCVAVICLSAALCARTIVALVRGFARTRRDRVQHLRQLSFLGSPDAQTGAVVVDHPRAVVYCLPGPSPAVVLTTGAIKALDGDELAAVLTHENAHLRGRHDLILAGSAGLNKALGFLPIFRWAHEEQARLLEMIADDAAAKVATRRTVAAAMVHMAESAVPTPALGAGGAHTVARVERMLRPNKRVGHWKTAALVAALVAAALAPVGLAISPAATAAGFEACGPVGS